MATRTIKPNKDSNETNAERKLMKGMLMLVTVSCVLLLMVGGGGTAWYFGWIQDGTETSRKQKPPVFLSLETFTVNLQAKHNDQHLQTNLTLKVVDERTVDLINLHMPDVRNRILLLLSSKAASEISTVEGKKNLASQLATEINRPFGEGRQEHVVERVLFTSFVIQ